MAHADDPALMRPHEILSEVAAILARGYLRHRHARRIEAARAVQNGDVGQSKESAQSTENCLDKAGEPSLHSRDG